MKRTQFILSAGLMIATIVVAGLPARASASDFSDLLSGYFMVFDYTDPTGTLSKMHFFDGEYPEAAWMRTDRAGLRLQLRLAGELSPNASFDVSVNFEYDVARALRGNNPQPQDGMAVFFKEGFISLRNVLGFIDMKLGRQYIFWGRIEWGGVLDIISPWDFANMSAEKENYRIAVDAARIYFNIWKGIALETVIIPVFSANHVPLELPDELGDFSTKLQPAQMPNTNVKNTEVALRLHIPIFEDGEFSAIYFRGFDRIFSLYPKADFLTKTITFTPSYKPLQVAGADAEYFLGPVNTMLEFAYYHTADENGDDIFITNRKLATAAGIEWDITSDLSLFAAFNYTHLLNYDRQHEYDQRKLYGEPDPYVARQNQYSVVYRFRYFVRTDMSIQLMQTINLLDWDFMTLAFVSWEARTGLKIYAGTVLFRGPNGTVFGRLEQKSRLFFEMKYSF